MKDKKNSIVISKKHNPDGGECGSREGNKFETEKTLCIGREKISVWNIHDFLKSIIKR